MRRLPLLALIGFAFFVACKDDDDHTHAPGSFPACEEIAEACHPLDTGSGTPHECHELSESATSEATCTAKTNECLTACKSNDAGTSSDAAKD